MADDSVWIAVTSDGTVTAWDTIDAARNHLRDDDGDVWVEHVTINRTQEPAEAPSTAAEDEDAPAGPTNAPSAAYGRTWISPPGLIYPDLADWDFRSANFTYSNWNEPHTYVCAICDAQGLTRPPIGVLELSPFEDDGRGGEFIALCYTHMGIEVKKWTDHFDEKHRTEA